MVGVFILIAAVGCGMV